jgi:hypothetical protein
MEPKRRTLSIGYVVIAVIMMLIAQAVLFAPHAENVTYSEFKALVKKGKVSGAPVLGPARRRVRPRLVLSHATLQSPARPDGDWQE